MARPADSAAEIVERVRRAASSWPFADRRDRLPLQLPRSSRESAAVIVEDARGVLRAPDRQDGHRVAEPQHADSVEGVPQSRRCRDRRPRSSASSAPRSELVLSAPLLLAIAVAIRLDSRGPVLFVQSRGGTKRAAVRAPEVQDDAPSDGVAPRNGRGTTPTVSPRSADGWRRLRLDELPQLVNVLRAR